jgi:hypothetical protein
VRRSKRKEEGYVPGVTSEKFRPKYSTLKPKSLKAANTNHYNTLSNFHPKDNLAQSFEHTKRHENLAQIVQKDSTPQHPKGLALGSIQKHPLTTQQSIRDRLQDGHIKRQNRPANRLENEIKRRMYKNESASRVIERKGDQLSYKSKRQRTASMSGY